MLKYSNVIDGWTPRTSAIPCAASSGLSLFPGSSTLPMRSGGTGFAMSSSRFEGEQPRVRLLDDADLDAADGRDLLALHHGQDRLVGGVAAVGKVSSRKDGLASSTIFCPRRQSLSR